MLLLFSALCTFNLKLSRPCSVADNRINDTTYTDKELVDLICYKKMLATASNVGKGKSTVIPAHNLLGVKGWDAA